MFLLYQVIQKVHLTAIRQIAEMKVDVPMLAMTHCDAAKLSKQHGKNSQYALMCFSMAQNINL